MATRNIVPRADGEGSIGTLLKKWGAVYADGIFSPGVKLYDIDASNVLQLKWNEDDAANRILNLLVNGADRSINLGGDLALTGANQVAAWTIGTTLSILDDAQIVGGAGFDSRLIPYEETLNDAIIWGLPVAAKRGLIFCDVADIGGDFTGLITATGFPEINLVDLDLDSRIRLGFTADDKPTILLQSGAYYSLIQESQAEGLAGADLRIGLDESNRTFIICDRGDIATDFGLTANADPTLYISKADGSTEAIYRYGYINLNSTVLQIDATSSAPAAIKAWNELRFTMIGDLANGNAYGFTSNANIELTDTNAEQAWMYLEPKVKQTATAAFDALHVDLFAGNTYGDGSTGNGNNFICLTDNGALKYRVDITGGIFPAGMKSGANQGAAGAVAGELWWDTDDNIIKMGV